MKTIIFDMHGVIIKQSKGVFVSYVYKHFPNTDKETLVRHFRQASIGKITGNEFLAKLGFENVELTTKDYIENNLTFDTGFINFVQKNKAVYRFALLSNDVLSWSEYITSHYDIDKYFSTKIISAAVGYRKPDKVIYEIILERLGIPADECIYIDNSVKNLLIAQQLGMDTVLFNRDGELYDGNFKVIYSFEELDDILQRKK